MLSLMYWLPFKIRVILNYQLIRLEDITHFNVIFMIFILHFKPSPVMEIFISPVLCICTNKAKMPIDKTTNFTKYQMNLKTKLNDIVMVFISEPIRITKPLKHIHTDKEKKTKTFESNQRYQCYILFECFNPLKYDYFYEHSLIIVT